MNRPAKALRVKLELVTASFRVPLVFVLATWVSYLLQAIFPLLALGIRPRSLTGLIGVLMSPLLHGSMAHITANTISFVSVGLLFFLTVKKKFLLFAQLWFLSGFLTWLVGRPNTVHIGASSLIFAMIGFLMAYGFFKRSFGSVAITALAMLLYGGTLWGLLPSGPHISWEGHLAGFLAGLLLRSARPRI